MVTSNVKTALAVLDTEKSEVRCDRCNRRLKKVYWATPIDADEPKIPLGPTCYKRIMAIVLGFDTVPKKVKKI